jgi:hypothetical protein
VASDLSSGESVMQSAHEFMQRAELRICKSITWASIISSAQSSSDEADRQRAMIIAASVASSFLKRPSANDLTRSFDDEVVSEGQLSLQSVLPIKGSCVIRPLLVIELIRFGFRTVNYDVVSAWSGHYSILRRK